MTQEMPDDARKAALSILNALNRSRQTLDRLMEGIPDNSVPGAKRDRALLHALVFGVLRWRGRLDWIIGHFSKTPLDKIQPEVLNILRLGLFQLIYLNRIPPSAAVNTAVELAKLVAAPWTVRFVNALLRTAAREHDTVAFPDPASDPCAALAASKSFPEWLIRRWLNRFGYDATAALCDTLNTIPPITVRTNTLKARREQLMQSLEGSVRHILPTPYAPDGVSFYQPNRSVADFKAFADGWFQVQDEAAQLVTYLLNPQPGESVLDACAGLGGKSGHMAQLMGNRGRILAIDIDAGRLSQLESEMRRLGISIVSTAVHDLTHPLEAAIHGRFDRILCDAPCSGLGVLRRNPDAKWVLGKKRLPKYQARQLRLLENLVQLLEASGTMVYAVCSMEPEETEEVVDVFLKRHPEVVIRDNLSGFVENASALIDQKRCFRSYSHLHGMDGFFAVCFRRLK